LNALKPATFGDSRRINVEDGTNPIAPAHLCQAFRLAMRELELSVNSRLIIFKVVRPLRDVQSGRRLR